MPRGNPAAGTPVRPRHSEKCPRLRSWLPGPCRSKSTTGRPSQIKPPGLELTWGWRDGNTPRKDCPSMAFPQPLPWGHHIHPPWPTPAPLSQRPRAASYLRSGRRSGSAAAGGSAWFDSVSLFACGHRSLRACGSRRLWEKEMGRQPERSSRGQFWGAAGGHAHRESAPTRLGNKHSHISHTHTHTLSLLLTHSHSHVPSLIGTLVLIHTHVLSHVHTHALNL